MPTPDLLDRHPLLDVNDLARSLGTTERFVRYLVNTRALPVVKVGRHVRFRPEDVEAYISRNTRNAR
jgi:excisionase family DNA binding protein